MKYTHLFASALIFISAPLFFGCDGPVKENKNNASVSAISMYAENKDYYKIDPKETVVEWKGSSLQGAHSGYVYLSKGELLVENGQLIGGAVEVDMNTIEDESHMSDNNLIEHLKDADFFDVKKFPSATMVITKVASTNIGDKEISGNLTIKGITHPVSFAAKTEVKDGIVKASARLVIDRTKWGVRYRSGKFFENLADKTISDSIEFKISIVAKK